MSGEHKFGPGSTAVRGDGAMKTLIPAEDADSEQRSDEKPNLKGDVLNIAVLIYLYVLQTIPSSISSTIPLILQSRKATYSDQAAFSFVSYVRCFRLLWAPLVDCVYWRRLGRRKTWVVPTMYVMAVFMFLMSMNVDAWLGTEDGTRKPNVQLLAIFVLACKFLCSIQEVALGGWCMTWLQKRNIGYAGMCNGIGNSISRLLGFVLLIVLDSKEFCNKFRSVPKEHGFITLAEFIFFWSIVIAASATLLLIFKKETRPSDVSDANSDYKRKLTLKESYKLLWQILKLRVVQKFCFFLLTYHMCFGVLNGVVRLKLIDAGIPRYDFALLTVPSIPFALSLPFFIGRYMMGKRSMRTYFALYLFRLVVMSGAYASLVFIASFAKKDNNGTLATWYYCLLVLTQSFSSVLRKLMNSIIGAFFTQVSDPRFGGIYVTLLSTADNIGARWPVSVSLWLVDFLTIRTCDDENSKTRIVLDGFYTETLLFTVIGLLWFYWGRRQIRQLEAMDPSSWIVNLRSNVDAKKDDELYYSLEMRRCEATS